jgi:hypothetical protein
MNTNLGINNERQDHKVGTMWGAGTCGRGRVNGGDEVRECGWWTLYTFTK